MGTGLTVNQAGTMNVVWGDFNLNNGWQGPKAFGGAHLAPGATVSIFQQSPGVWAGLTVESAGTLNVVWADFNRNDGEQGPKAFGGSHLAPGAPVSIFQQSPGVWTGRDRGSCRDDERGVGRFQRQRRLESPGSFRRAHTSRLVRRCRSFSRAQVCGRG